VTGMASIAGHCSLFWIIPKSRQTTTARDESCLPPPLVAESPEASAQPGAADLYAAVLSTVGTTAKQGSHAFDSIRNVLKSATA
jgi:hypothetical protein